MIELLRKTHAHPLEREYEAWIVAEIERYFEALKVDFAIWAVSPDEEATWPADEKLLTATKIVGLQFKQAKLGAGAVGVDRLKWTLHQPPGQFHLVQGTPEIFYVLPTFVNRSARHRALDHCLFWRPDAAVNLNAWYDNPAAKTPYKKLRGSMRWGHFVESLFECSIGVRASDPAEGRAAIARIYSRTAEFLPRRQEPSPEPDLGLYVLAFRVGS
jgi:hypothetical protein